MKHLLILLALLSFAFTGCKSTDTDSIDSVSDAASLTICGDCGEMKGTDTCCAEDAEKCACGLTKGSPGCCKIEAGTDVVVCTGCGMAKGGEGCCDEGAERCAGCGMIAGSLACCTTID